MPAPYNYMAMIPRPDFARSIEAGAKLGEAIGGAVQASRQREADEQFKRDLQETLKNPTFRSFADLSAKYPDRAENIQKMNERMEEGERKAAIKTATDAFAAMETGNVETAKAIVDEYIAAGTAAGQDMRVVQGIRNSFDKDPNAAKAGLGIWASNSDPKRWGEITTAYEARAKSKAEREQAQITVKKLGTEIGLTEAQIKQAEAATAASRAAANKSGAEAERARAEAEQMARGVMPPDKRAAAEDKLRAEYNTQTKDFFTTDRYYRNIISAQDDAAGDLALIFSYMKLLDPGSAVMEGEQATVANAKGVPDKIRNAYNNALEGRRLSPDQVKVFTTQAEKLYDSAAAREKQVRDGLTRIGQGYGLNLDNVFYQPGGVEKPQRPTPPVSGTANPVVNIPAGTPLSNDLQRYVPQAGGR